MYDIEFVIPISLSKKYLWRLDDFKKIGVINPANRKAVVTLLSGNEIEKSDLPGIEEYILDEWDERIDVRIHRGGTMNSATKLYDYFSKMKKIDARWICKFDDDSCNDIDALVTGLDRDFDSDREYYIMAERREECHDIDKEIACKHGFGHWWCHMHKAVWHEKEGSIVSAACMQRILDDPVAVKMMEERAAVSDGWGDIMLAYAARAVKVRPSDASFLSANSDVFNYTHFGGSRAHIHFVARDIDPTTIKVLIGCDSMPPQFIDNEWLWREEDGEAISILKFAKSHQILSKPKVDAASFWQLQGNTLKIFGPHINATSSYELDEKIMMGSDISSHKAFRLTVCL
jgi:hypothetical protein